MSHCGLATTFAQWCQVMAPFGLTGPPLGELKYCMAIAAPWEFLIIINVTQWTAVIILWAKILHYESSDGPHVYFFLLHWYFLRELLYISNKITTGNFSQNPSIFRIIGFALNWLSNNRRYLIYGRSLFLIHGILNHCVERPQYTAVNIELCQKKYQSWIHIRRRHC